MMKKYLYFIVSLLMLLAVSNSNSFAQQTRYSSKLFAGIGVGNGTDLFTAIRPKLFVNYNFTFLNLGDFGHFDLGAHYSNSRSYYRLIQSEKLIQNESVIGLRLQYNYMFGNSFLLYASGLVGFRSANELKSATWGNHQIVKEGTVVSGSIGAMYFVLPNLGAFVSTGDGAAFNAGLSFRF